MADSAGQAEASRLYLIDGSSYVFRAYFALPRLTHSSGLSTHAIYGFTTMTLKFLKEYRPCWLAVVFDTGAETFRDGISRDYKANRPEAPQDLVAQFPYIREVVRAMNIPVLERDGFEADDLIGTLAKHFSAARTETVIVSGDKDLMQVVDDSVRLLDTMKSKWIGVEEVRQRFGVEPSRVVDVIALMGDSVDNIPGVRGIGQKTATALIQNFHTLDNLYENLDELDRANIKGAARVRKALIEGREDAFMSRQLATVRTDVPLPLELEYFRFHGLSEDKLRDLFNQLEFTQLLKGLASEHRVT